MWKLVHPTGFGRESLSGEPKLELYNMLSDPLEMNDVADQHPDVVARMKREYEAWFRDVSSTRPDNYAPHRLELPAGTGSCAFQNIRLEKGNVRLEVVLTHAGSSRGIHQADVFRR